MKIVHIKYFFLVTLAVNALITNLLGTELTSAQKMMADHVLLGVDDTVMRINSGTCRITGTTVYPGSGRILEDDILLIFDYGTNNYRFENGKYMRALLNPDFFYEVWHPGDPSQFSVKRSLVSDYEVTYTDCRIVDIQNLFQFTPVGPHKPFEYQNSDFHKNNSDIIKTEYNKQSAAIIKIVTETPFEGYSPIIKEYYIDTDKGYTPVHIKVTHENFVNYAHDISWALINSTWVPTAYSFQSSIGKPFSVDWKIEWESVNEKIDPILFNLDEMLSDQKEGGVLLTTELGPNPVILGRIEHGESFKKQQTLPREASSFRIVLISAGIVFIVIGLWRKVLISRYAKMAAATQNDRPVP